jgi:large subunit ribosomal protein L21
MYAVFEDRNQQYRVTEGESVLLPLAAGLAPGAELTFDKVCAVGGSPPQIGTPYVQGARVKAVVTGEVKGPKLVVRKMRRRKNSRVRTGFRARYTEVRIAGIEVAAGGG